jgi:VWFA-related protein
VAIYTISTNRTTGFRSREQERGDRVLKRFSDETGGKMFSPARLEELTQDFLNIGDELRAQYTLAYRPTNSQRDGTFRRVRIDISDRRYEVRARQGYYAPRNANIR